MLRHQTAPKHPSDLSLKLLIVESWRLFVHNWKTTFSISIWLMAPATLLLLVTLLDRVIPTTLAFLPLLILLLSLCIQAWVSLQLIRYTLVQLGEVVAPSTWQTDITAYLWTKLLNCLAIVGSLLPFVLSVIGLPLFIALTRPPERSATMLLFGVLGLLALPAIWLGISLMFWPLVLVSEPQGIAQTFTTLGGRRWLSIKKTVAILTASFSLVRGRFWYTFMRVIVPGLLFVALSLAFITLVDSLIQFIAGPAKIAALFGSNSLTFIDVNHTTGNAYVYFLQAVGEAVFFPLFIVWQTKLFLSLRKTQ